MGLAVIQVARFHFTYPDAVFCWPFIGRNHEYIVDNCLDSHLLSKIATGKVCVFSDIDYKSTFFQLYPYMYKILQQVLDVGVLNPESWQKPILPKISLYIDNTL